MIIKNDNKECLMTVEHDLGKFFIWNVAESMRQLGRRALSGSGKTPPSKSSWKGQLIPSTGLRGYPVFGYESGFSLMRSRFNISEVLISKKQIDG